MGSSLEIFENRRTLIEEEIDRGIQDENGGNFLQKVPKMSHLLFIDTDRAKTLDVTHLRPDIVYNGHSYNGRARVVNSDEKNSIQSILIDVAFSDGENSVNKSKDLSTIEKTQEIHEKF